MWFISQKAKDQYESNPDAQICYRCGKPAEHPWIDACRRHASILTVVEYTETPVDSKSKPSYCSECGGVCNGGH
jgi:hypothetical protein